MEKAHASRFQVMDRAHQLPALRSLDGSADRTYLLRSPGRLD